MAIKFVEMADNIAKVKKLQDMIKELIEEVKDDHKFFKSDIDDPYHLDDKADQTEGYLEEAIDSLDDAIKELHDYNEEYKATVEAQERETYRRINGEDYHSRSMEDKMREVGISYEDFLPSSQW